MGKSNVYTHRGGRGPPPVAATGRCAPKEHRRKGIPVGILAHNAMKRSRYSLLLRFLLALVALAGLLYWGANTHDDLLRDLHPGAQVRRAFTVDPDTRVVNTLEPEASLGGLVKGAVLESLNGRPYLGQAQMESLLHPAPPGGKLYVGFTAPNGSHRTATVVLAPLGITPTFPTTRAQLWQHLVQYSLVPLLCMLIGYWVVFIKVDEANAWLLLTLLLYPAAIFGNPPGTISDEWFAFRTIYNFLFGSIPPLALLPFAIYFPERSRIDIRFPWVKWAILVPAAVGLGCDLRQIVGRVFWGRNPPWLTHLLSVADRVVAGLELLCLALYFLLLFNKLRKAGSADVRRRLRVLLSGTGIGIGSLLGVFVLLPALGYNPFQHGRAWLAYLGSTLFLLAPFSLAYVVLVQRAMDVRILVRQGTKYALARATLWVVQAGILFFVAVTLMRPGAFGHHGHTPWLQLAVFIGLMIVFRLGVRKATRNWLDRKFFREAYNAEQVLSDLAQEVQQFTESGLLLQTVARRVSETLHPQPIAMLVRKGANFCLEEAIELSPPAQVGREIVFTAASSIVRKVLNDRSFARLYRKDPDAWYLLASEAEREMLDRLQAELILPLFGRGRLMGMMLLGPKQSEAAYSRTDLRLLQALATQTGMALEVGELAHSLAREATERMRTTQELELARAVQERLFPQQMPVIPGITVAGACRPAQIIGGDYYDVFPLGDGRFAFALGDVSGKGTSAALLMAGLRASIRALALDLALDPAQIMGRMNRLVFEASETNRFATFFFAVYDPAARLLECVNAGHNPPMLLRRAAACGTPGPVDGCLVRLEADGPVIGLLEGVEYTCRSWQLAPGDLLVAFTDGFSEAMTAEDEEWGDDRLAAALEGARENSAAAVLQALFYKADAFTAGATQHDDMTALVLKLDDLAQPVP
jgi:sigma-B regulation protein RsbU (phosphoserine phosphatase)